MRLKKVTALLTFSALTLMSTSSFAGQDVCGIGKIIEVREGGFKSDDLLVKLEDSAYDEEGSDVAGTRYRDLWIRFRVTSLSKERRSAIRSLAYLALVSSKPVYIWTHNGECRDATELALFSEGNDPRDIGTDEVAN